MNKKSKFALGMTSLFLLLLCSPLLFANAASAATYSVTINTSFNSVSNGNSVAITEDGVSTTFVTPHTFSDLIGIHNFTVPYEDSAGHPFFEWGKTAQSNPVFTTITTSSSGTYWAVYDSKVPRQSQGTVNAVSPAEQRYYVTPSDPAVVAAAANKSWNDILDWIASQLTYNFSDPIWQFPNETLSLGSGQCRDYATLCVSMLLSRGYTAYVVTGNVTAASGTEIYSETGHAWVVIKLNDTLYHFEPQRTLANQPSPQNFSSGYFAEYFNDNEALYPASPSQDPPATQTYDITISTQYSSSSRDANVAISRNGVFTGFTTPHTFTGMNGVQNFTIPVEDLSGHSFIAWSTNTPGERIYPTITVSSGGSFVAVYDSQLSLNSLWPAEYRYLITPSDPAVISAAMNKNLSGIVDFVSDLPYAICAAPQFPNQTLSRGTCLTVDLATVCVSLLRSAGFVAYLVEGANSASPNGTWVVVSYNGTFYHLDPHYSWENQQTVNFGSYQASYYVDEKGIYPAGISQDPPLNVIDIASGQNQTSQVPEFSSTLVYCTLALVLMLAVVLKKRIKAKKES
ncbi:MAG TPA: transglutaminase domain-containing protein [Candidatus Nanoarchaeia archaeon]|nr:transglutaminase domain-containing protein [Candidatus Nanoarchaeia archaeon]